ncbi:plus-3-domain-containing protein [Panus rudis PR-1116 ss-1]|nr:plus-3-domain-containing protein [Panus rudis PR-1116 ss-1]
MSDSEGDLSDELLELAGEGLNSEKKRKKRHSQSKSNKRRKAEVSSDSEEDAPESEEEEHSSSNPYPLEGKYIDEADRQRLMQLSEIEREDILAERQEEMQRIKMRNQLDQMVKDQSGAGKKEDSVSKSAKRTHTQRGATKEKTRKLDELKAKRKAKDERKRIKTSDSPRRDRSSSPTDMEMSDEEDEDGQINKFQEEEERIQKYYGKETTAEEEPITLHDLERIRLTRQMIAKHYLTPWFEDYVKGAFVRYLIGQDEKTKQPIYRICEVTDLGADLVKPYQVDNQRVNQMLELRHGSAVKLWSMDKVSNSTFTQREFDRLMRVCEVEKVKLPTKRQIEKKATQMQTLASQPLTESDINAIIARKAALQPQKLTGTALMMEKARLTQARTLALRRNDTAEVAEIDAQLAKLVPPSENTSTKEETVEDVLAKVNERNRRANAEAMRAAELQAERKRRERKLAAMANGGSATPTTPDAAGRFKHKMLQSRGGTPGGLTPQPGTPLAAAPTSADGTPAKTTPEKPPSDPNHKQSFQDSILASIEIDLGDF